MTAAGWPEGCGLNCTEGVSVVPTQGLLCCVTLRRAWSVSEARSHGHEQKDSSPNGEEPPRSEVGGVAPAAGIVSGSEADVSLCAHRQAPVLTEE